MNRTHQSFFLSFFLIFSLILCPITEESVQADSAFSFVVLNRYSVTLPVGGEFSLFAFTSNGKQPTFKSSNASIASVNTYGRVTAKKSGKCKITAKIKNAEASCQISVSKTKITLNVRSLTLENGKHSFLSASVSTQHPVVWKSNKRRIATVSEKGEVVACNPGKATITASVDGTYATCQVTVKSPKVRISATSKTLYRNERFQLSATVSSGRAVAWKSSRKNVATVSPYGIVTAIKHGTAIISATVDGVTKSCLITVAQPTILLSTNTLTLTVGDKTTIFAKTNGPNVPEWSSSNINVATVDSHGHVTARQKGKAYLYAKEDGVKVSCILTVLPAS